MFFQTYFMDILQNDNGLFWTPERSFPTRLKLPLSLPSGRTFPPFAAKKSLPLKLSGWRLAPVPPGPPEMVGRRGMPRD